MCASSWLRPSPCAMRRSVLPRSPRAQPITSPSPAPTSSARRRLTSANCWRKSAPSAGTKKIRAARGRAFQAAGGGRPASCAAGLCPLAAQAARHRQFDGRAAGAAGLLPRPAHVNPASHPGGAAYAGGLHAHSCPASRPGKPAPLREGQDGEMLQPGHVYLAPGDFHMTLVRHGRDIRIGLTKETRRISAGLRSTRCSAVRRCFRPACPCGDVHRDGQRRAGGRPRHRPRPAVPSSPQDEQTSVVWGMPGAVAMAGLCAPCCRCRRSRCRSLARPRGAARDRRRFPVHRPRC